MGVCDSQFAGKGGTSTSPTVTILFNAITAFSFCTLVPVKHHNHQPV